MQNIINFPLFLIGAITVILLPGPNSLYCLSVASQRGIRAAFQVMAAIFVGDALLILLAVGGAASLLQTYPLLFVLFKAFGGGYLLYLAWGLLGAARQTWQRVYTENLPTQGLPPQQNVFKRALLLSVSNPKAIMFFLSFFIPFVPANAPQPLLGFLLLALSLQGISMLYLLLLSLAGSRLSAWFAGKKRLMAAAQAAAGLLFVVFALNLWQSVV